jgi:hypothetical protein
VQGEQATTPALLTHDDAVMWALTAFWFRGEAGRRAGLNVIGVLLDWRADCALLARTGEDGAL